MALRPYCEVLAPRSPVPVLLVPMTPTPELMLLPLMHQLAPVTEHDTVVTALIMPAAMTGSALSVAAAAPSTVMPSAAVPTRRVRALNLKANSLGDDARRTTRSQSRLNLRRRRAGENLTAPLSADSVPYVCRRRNTRPVLSSGAYGVMGGAGTWRAGRTVESPGSGAFAIDMSVAGLILVMRCPV